MPIRIPNANPKPKAKGKGKKKGTDSVESLLIRQVLNLECRMRDVESYTQTAYQVEEDSILYNEVKDVVGTWVGALEKGKQHSMGPQRWSVMAGILSGLRETWRQKDNLDEPLHSLIQSIPNITEVMQDTEKLLDKLESDGDFSIMSHIIAYGRWKITNAGGAAILSIRPAEIERITGDKGDWISCSTKRIAKHWDVWLEVLSELKLDGPAPKGPLARQLEQALKK